MPPVTPPTLSPLAVGLTVVALGTSTPEVAVYTEAALAGQGDVGNVVGSNVFNLLGVLGIAAAVRPLTVDPAVVAALIWLVVVTGAVTAVLATGRRLTRLEGIVLVALAAGYWLVTAVG